MIRADEIKRINDKLEHDEKIIIENAQPMGENEYYVSTVGKIIDRERLISRMNSFFDKENSSCKLENINSTPNGSLLIFKDTNPDKIFDFVTADDIGKDNNINIEKTTNIDSMTTIKDSKFEHKVRQDYWKISDTENGVIASCIKRLTKRVTVKNNREYPSYAMTLPKVLVDWLDIDHELYYYFQEGEGIFISKNKPPKGVLHKTITVHVKVGKNSKNYEWEKEYGNRVVSVPQMFWGGAWDSAVYCELILSNQPDFYDKKAPRLQIKVLNLNEGDNLHDDYHTINYMKDIFSYTEIVESFADEEKSDE